jgi:trans-aconitate methyltransferase
MLRAMDQTPAHDEHNADLLEFMDRPYRTVVEVGCSRGALARAYLKKFPAANYIGVELDPENADAARAHCRHVVCGDIERLSEKEKASLFPSDCWVFGDALEHLRDPWATLGMVRASIAKDGQVLACIPNAQHWSMVVRLASGLFRYEDQGLLDRTHLRWFTRVSMIELFESTGFKVIEMHPRIFDEPMKDAFLPGIASIAAAAGSDAKLALSDALPVQYIVRAEPA